MTTHKRSEGQTAVSVSIPKDLLAEVDKRASALRLNRSQYLVQLAVDDLRERGEMVIREMPPAEKPPVSSAPGHPISAAVVGSSVVKYSKKRRKTSKPAGTP
jgi:hypothetical protein